MTNSNGVQRTLQRKADILAAHPKRHTAIRRAAESLTRRNADQAIAELLNEALQACVRLCYERNDDGTPANVDGVTARILVPLPWGKAGHRRWGLRRGEAEALRAILFARQAQGNGLFLYDRSRRSWYLNVADYPTLRLAGGYVAQHPIGVTEYRQVRSQMQAA